jgi:K+-transporting ATPase c subunit
MSYDEIWSMIRKRIRSTLLIFVMLTLLCGIIYSLVIAGIAGLTFPMQATGCLRCPLV